MLVQKIRILLMIFSCSLYAKDTELKFYRPFTIPNLEQSLINKEKKQGTCSEQSQIIQREDAWRCLVDNKIYDPCFINKFGNTQQALCQASPWEAPSIQLDLEQATDGSQQLPLDLSRTYPWAIELTSGYQCKALENGQIFDGVPVHYQCVNHAILFGPLQRCKSEWSMLQRQANGEISTATIAKAWF